MFHLVKTLVVRQLESTTQIINDLDKRPFWEDLNKQKDNLGRTPALCLLGRGGSSNATEEVSAQQGSRHSFVGSLEANLNALLRTQGDANCQRSHLIMPLTCGGGRGVGAIDSNTLCLTASPLHGARGGQEGSRLPFETTAEGEMLSPPSVQLHEALPAPPSGVGDDGSGANGTSRVTDPMHAAHGAGKNSRLAIETTAESDVWPPPAVQFLEPLTSPPAGVGGNGDGRSNTNRLTGLMHAARGGRETFTFACERIADAVMSPPCELRLHEALGLRYFTGDPNGVDNGLFDERCGQLLAQAALGGDLVVMNMVTAGIEVGWGERIIPWWTMQRVWFYCSREAVFVESRQMYRSVCVRISSK